MSGAKEGVTIPAVLGLVAASIVAVGLFPERMMGLMSRSAAGTVVNFGVMTEQLATVKLWTVSSYTAVAVPVAIGVLIFFAARHFKFGAGTVPWWLSVEALIYRPVTQGFLRFCCRYVTRVEGGICDLYDRSGSVSHSVLRRVRKLDDMLDEGYEASQRTTTLVVEQARGLEHGIEEAYARVGHQVATLPTGAASVEGEITAVYTRVGQAAVDTTRRLRNEAASDNHATEQQPEVWNPQNVTLGSLVVAAVMFVVLVVLYAVGIRVLR